MFFLLILSSEHYLFFCLDVPGAKQNGTKLGDVILPPWAKGDPREFIRVHREVRGEPTCVTSRTKFQWANLTLRIVFPPVYRRWSVITCQLTSMNGSTWFSATSNKAHQLWRRSMSSITSSMRVRWTFTISTTPWRRQPPLVSLIILDKYPNRSETDCLNSLCYCTNASKSCVTVLMSPLSATSINIRKWASHLLQLMTAIEITIVIFFSELISFTGLMWSWSNH